MEIKNHMDFFGNTTKEGVNKSNKQEKKIVEDHQPSAMEQMVWQQNKDQEIAILKETIHQLKVRVWFSAGIIVMLSLTVFKLIH